MAKVGGPVLTYVSFLAEIILVTIEVLIATMVNLANQGVQEVCLMIFSLGGSVMNGLNFYNVFRVMLFQLSIYNVGNVDSIANALFLVGDWRFASPHFTFMFHGVGFDVSLGTRLEEKFLRERFDGIVADQRRIGTIFAEWTIFSQEQIDVLFFEATTKDAAYAAGVGIVDEVVDFNIPLGATILSLVFQR